MAAMSVQAVCSYIILSVPFFTLIYGILDLISKASSQQANNQSFILVRNNINICFLLKSVLRSWHGRIESFNSQAR